MCLRYPQAGRQNIAAVSPTHGSRPKNLYPREGGIFSTNAKNLNVWMRSGNVERRLSTRNCLRVDVGTQIERTLEEFQISVFDTEMNNLTTRFVDALNLFVIVYRPELCE
jgi:hypothetical protein